MTRDRVGRVFGQELVLAGTGVGIAALGLIALGASYAGITWIVKPFPGSVAMAPFTASSFILLGSALLSFAAGRRSISTLLATVAGTLQLFALLPYGTSYSFDFDTLVRIPHPAAPAPNTIVALLFLSIAVFLMNSPRRATLRVFVPAIFASLAIAIAFTTLVGYFIGVRTFGWGQSVPMAINTAIGLLLFGLAILVFAWQRACTADHAIPDWLLVSAVLFSSVFTVSIWNALRLDGREQAKRAIHAELAELDRNITNQFDLRKAALTQAAQRWQGKGEPGAAEWELESALLLKEPSRYEFVAWVSPDLRIRMIAPSEHQQLAGADLGMFPQQRTALETAGAGRLPTVSHVIELAAGHRSIAIYAPVFRNGSSAGFLMGSFPLDRLIPELLPDAVAAHDLITIFDGSDRIYASAEPDRASGSWSQQSAVALGGTGWTVRFTPSREKIEGFRSHLPEAVLVKGLFMTIALGVCIFFAQKASARERAAEQMRRGIEREIHERHQAQEELTQFFELPLEMLCIIDGAGYFKRLNPAFERTLGYGSKELQAQPFLNFVHPEDRERTVVVTQELAEGKPLSSFENRYITRDGSVRWLQWAATSVPDRSLIFATARDVTEMKAAVDALQRAHDELESRVTERTEALQKTNDALKLTESQVNELNRELESRVAELTATNHDLEAFTYSVSHDLRAPLRHVDGFSQILLEGFGDQLPEKARPLLDQVRRGSQRMGRMIDELLQLSRTARREPEKRLTGLRSLVDEVIADLHMETAGRELEWRIGDLPFADCDPVLIRQVFVNLFANAVKFTRLRQRAVIEVGQTNVNGERTLFVRDNGVGFSMKYADKLFGPFQRLHRQEDFEGTGVGLATVQRIIQKHGGHIRAEAELDKGATFYFTLEPASSTAGRTEERNMEELEVCDAK